jgi:hypothetical protein
MPNLACAGKAFSAAGQLWTLTLCSADSDGDGLSNGEELGDPCCTCSASLALPNAREFTHPRTKAPRYMEGRDRTFPKLGNLAPRGMQHAKCSIGIRRERKSSMRACVERAVFQRRPFRQGSDAYYGRMRQDSACRACTVAYAACYTLHAARSLLPSQDAASKSTAPGCPLGVLNSSASTSLCAALHSALAAHQTTASRARAYGIIAARSTATAHAPCGHWRRQSLAHPAGEPGARFSTQPFVGCRRAARRRRACVWGLPHTRAV